MQAKEEEEDSSKELGKSNSSSEAVTLEDVLETSIQFY